jgi:hypothetical protein
LIPVYNDQIRIVNLFIEANSIETMYVYIGIELIYLVLVQDLMSFVRSYVVPEGFPDSVIPSYVPYMTWRALKVVYLTFFGWWGYKGMC